MTASSSGCFYVAFWLFGLGKYLQVKTFDLYCVTFVLFYIIWGGDGVLMFSLLVGQDVSEIQRKNGYSFPQEEDGLSKLLSLGFLWMSTSAIFFFASTTLQFSTGRCFLVMGVSVLMHSTERQNALQGYLCRVFSIDNPNTAVTIGA
jgi:hypothetical protein